MFINRRMDKLWYIHINTTQYQKEKSEGGEWSGEGRRKASGMMQILGILFQVVITGICTTLKNSSNCTLCGCLCINCIPRLKHELSIKKLVKNVKLHYWTVFSSVHICYFSFKRQRINDSQDIYVLNDPLKEIPLPSKGPSHSWRSFSELSHTLCTYIY